MENNGLNNLSKIEAIWVEAMLSSIRSGRTQYNGASARTVGQESVEVANYVTDKFIDRFGE